ncbi:LysR family transcriptional regulator, partial [Escherichia coli]|nr:LysR family transcriptional regulator [Escherichia coli]
MILDKLLFFTEIINSGSISGASNCFNISTATGSRWVKDLEDKLNVKLLRISNRGIEPTEAGIVLFKEFSSINEDINQLYKKINTINNSNSGVISISSTPLFTMNFLSTIIGEYLYKYPDIRFRVEESPIINENNKNIDFYIKASSTYKGYIENNSDLVKKVLFSYPLILCCSPDYINKYGIPTNPFSLKHHNCLYASSLVGGNCWHFYIRDEITTLEIAKTVNIENSEFLKAVALMGGG